MTRGTPLVPYIPRNQHTGPRPPEERFWEKVNKNGSVPLVRPDLGNCWLWMASRDGHGYGHFYFDGRMRSAYHFLVGRPPKGFEWDHLCVTPLCVRPEHLELLTSRDHRLRTGTFLIGARLQREPRASMYVFFASYAWP